MLELRPLPAPESSICKTRGLLLSPDLTTLDSVSPSLADASSQWRRRERRSLALSLRHEAELTCPIFDTVTSIVFIFLNAGSLSVYHCVKGPYAFGMHTD